MHIAELGAGLLVVFLHGCPKLWYSWRDQLAAVGSASFRAVAPDLRGFGETDAPHEIEGYSMKNRIDDVIGLLDVLRAEKYVLIGHYWGANLAWACAELYPERVVSLLILNVQYRQRSDASPSVALANFSGDIFTEIDKNESKMRRRWRIGSDGAGT